MNVSKNILVSVVGPTAVGKTSFAIELAKYLRTEIISADSRQFYREMEIGTAKPDQNELAEVCHHFIHSHSIAEYYSVGRFERDALNKLTTLFAKHHEVVAVGGSGLFFKALWEGMDEMPEVDLDLRDRLNKEFNEKGLGTLLEELQEKDPEYYHQVDQNNHQRVIRSLEVIRTTGKPFSSFRKGSKQERDFINVKIGLEMGREQLYERINKRMDVMIESGLFEEAERLVPFRQHNALQTVGYSEIFGYFDGLYDRDEAIRLLKRNSRRYAKRQITWFRKDPEVVWMDPLALEKAKALIEDARNNQ